MRRSASRPPIPGILRSRRTTSKSRARNCSSAPSPLSTLVTAQPARGSSFSMRRRVGRSSSTTSTLIPSTWAAAWRMSAAPSTAPPLLAPRLPPLSQGEPHGHDGPLRDPLTPDLDGAPMLLDDALADGEAEARPLPHLLGGEERIEDPREVFRGDPAAVI